jgi:hypothetical protein
LISLFDILLMILLTFYFGEGDGKHGSPLRPYAQLTLPSPPRVLPSNPPTSHRTLYPFVSFLSLSLSLSHWRTPLSLHTSSRELLFSVSPAIPSPFHETFAFFSHGNLAYCQCSLEMTTSVMNVEQITILNRSKKVIFRF